MKVLDISVAKVIDPMLWEFITTKFGGAEEKKIHEKQVFNLYESLSDSFTASQ